MKYLFALSFEALRPASVAAGIDAWTWVISEKPEYETGVMMERKMPEKPGVVGKLRKIGVC